MRNVIDLKGAFVYSDPDLMRTDERVVEKKILRTMKFSLVNIVRRDVKERGKQKK